MLYFMGIYSNIYRFSGDFFHLLAIFILLGTILRSQKCFGISGKSQILLSLVYITRYTDLFSNSIPYLVLFKCIFLLTSFITVYFIYLKFNMSSDLKHDTFRIEILIIPAWILAYFVNNQYSFEEICWTSSIYLEAVAILPQMFIIIWKLPKAQGIILLYLALLGLYRGMYIANWCYRYLNSQYLDWISIYSGSVETSIYIIFFGIYVVKVLVNGMRHGDKTYEGLLDETEKSSSLTNTFKNISPVLNSSKSQVFYIDVAPSKPKSFGSPPSLKL